MLLASECDHAIPELDDRPHVMGLGEALQRAGAAWVRLNPGSGWSGLEEENPVNLPLRLAVPGGWLLTDAEESPLRTSAGWAVSELTTPL